VRSLRSASLVDEGLINHTLSVRRRQPMSPFMRRFLVGSFACWFIAWLITAFATHRELLFLPAAVGLPLGAAVSLYGDSQRRRALGD
jgi:hypothetical protein